MFYKLKKPILITGASGFIGSNIARYFIQNNIEIHLILRKKNNWRLKDIQKSANIHYCDLASKDKLNKIISNIKPQTIFHLATHGSYSFQKNLDQIIKSNMSGTINLLYACKKFGFSKFINTGSSSEYGFKKKIMSEFDILEPNSHYAVLKSFQTNLTVFEALSNNLPIINVRPFHIYGPYEDSRRFIPNLILNLLNDKLPVLADKNICRDIVYIEDAVQFYLKLANKKNINGEIFNLGSGKKTKLMKIVRETQKIMNTNIKPEWNSMPNRSWDQYEWYANMNKAKKIINFVPKIRIEEGLRRTVDWFRDNYSLYK